ncbi:MAG: ATP-binding cassette domain-containing protein [Gammaproteobacteria bacterium]|nr:ABC transporter ATP-binding protein [Gammaproteobacteria bacterium]NNJ92400.1 ATP-binding cassette domain-containing protein [Gammaproteobacteria bacterium]
MVISVKNLHSALFNPVNFEAAQGQCLCIYGESGSGKTLLLRAIADLDPNEGSLALDNQARSNIGADQWRRQVTYLPAESFWWHTRVGEHFESNDTDWSILGLSQQIAEWQISRLSSGERQRLALLRALDHKPKVLLLDEVTANLDEENTLKVEALIKSCLQQGLIVIWVSHDKAQRKRMADQSFVIDETGFHKEA